MIRYYIFFILSLYLIASCTSKLKSEVPDFVAKQYNTKTVVGLKDIAKNKITFVNFWSIFCGPCLEELALIHRVYDKYKDNSKFTILTIALNTEDELDQFTSLSDTSSPYHSCFKISKLKRFYLPTLIGSKNGYTIEKLNNNLIAGIKDKEEVRKTCRLFNFDAIPTTFIYNEKGQIVYKSTGAETSQDGIRQYEVYLYHTIDSLLSK